MSDLINTDSYGRIKNDRTACVERAIKKELNKHKKVMPEALFHKLNPNNSVPPHIYGLPKIHKPGMPLRPIVSCIDSPCHKLARYLTDILSPLVGKSPSYVKDSKHLVEMLSQVTVQPDDIMASFDVESLFTNVPIEETLEILKDKLEKDTDLSTRTPLSKEAILELTRICITTTYFQYKDAFFQQKSGMAMGSPLSPLLANMYMEWFEQKAIETSHTKPRMWLRYVDDTFTIWQHGNNQLETFKDHLNSIAPTIRFTMEKEEEGKIPFLDVNVQRVGSQLEMSVYYKKTHTGRYLDFASNHTRSTKAGVIKCLTNRAQNICHGERLEEEKRNLTRTFMKNGYPRAFIEKAMVSKNRSTVEKEKPLKTITLPYIPGISEKLGRICSAHKIRAVHSSKETLGKSLRKVKPIRPMESTKNIIYEIPCKECEGSYIGESLRQLGKRVEEHKKAVQTCDQNNGIAKHSWEKSHQMAWTDVKILDKEANWHKRKIKEALYMRLNKKAFSEPSANTSSIWLPLLKNCV
jgi:hypothetical protein